METTCQWSLKQAQVSLEMAHHNHHLPPSPIVASSDQNLFLYLSISLPCLDQTQKYQLFFLHPILSKPQPLLSLDLGLKRDHTRECLGFGFRWWVSLSFFHFFFFFYANMSKLGMLAAVTDKVEGDAQSKCGCWESGVLGERKKET